jgi:isoprenylcysteine carboxyl methyltransferase (ICMT) family protein YpbQ
LWEVALIFSLLNAAVLSIRIRQENRALSACRPRPGETPARSAP